MSSILVGELRELLENYPDDYEVIFYIREKYKTSIAYINGCQVDDTFKEVRLMN